MSIRFYEDPLMTINPSIPVEDPALEELRKIAQLIAEDESIPWQENENYGRWKDGRMGGIHVEAKKSMMRALIEQRLDEFRALSISIWLRRTQTLKLKRMDKLEYSYNILKYVHNVLYRTGSLYTIEDSTLTSLVPFAKDFNLQRELDGVEYVLARMDAFGPPRIRIEEGTIIFNDDEFRVKIYRDRQWGTNELEEILVHAETVVSNPALPWHGAANGPIVRATKNTVIDGELLDAKRTQLLRRQLRFGATSIWFEVNPRVYVVLRATGYCINVAAVERAAPPIVVAWAFRTMRRERHYSLRGNALVCAYTPVVPADVQALVDQLRTELGGKVLKIPFLKDVERVRDIQVADLLGVPYVINDRNELELTFESSQQEYQFKQARFRGHTP